MHIILNHTLLQTENAHLSVQDRGFRYGDGVFETIAVHSGVPYRFAWHMDRLKRALEAIRISYDITALAPECRQLLNANRVKDGLLRIQVTRGVGGRGYLPGNTPPTCVIETMSLPLTPQQPVALWLSAYARPPAATLPTQFKLCNGLNSTLARMEATDQDCFDALMLDLSSHISETSSGNIFWLKKGVLYTPSLSCSALEGAVRAAIMELAPYPVKEWEAPLDELKNAEAVVITNSAWKVLPVSVLKPVALHWESTACAKRILEALGEDIARHSRTYAAGWQA